MGVLGDLNQYTKYQAAEAIGTAAANPGGLGGVGAQIAAGVAVGGQMAGALGWSRERTRAEVDAWRARVEAARAAEAERDDEAALRAATAEPATA